MKECFKPHVVMHSLIGLGIGFILASFIPALSTSTGLWLGIILVIIGIISEFIVNK